tara:strand:- start:13044 stop:14213 length:1170 start_codon:yes stop_codon:yes gene_type:complete
MNKKIIKILVLFPLLTIFEFAYSQCGDFEIQEDYFADQLIGFYINSIDINTGDTSVEYFRYRIIQENSQINNLKANYSLIINSPDLGLSNFEMMSGVVDISNITFPELVFSNLDINFDTQSIPGADFKSEESNLASLDELEAIQSVILSSGKIPNGTYIFNVTLRCTDDDSIIYDSITKTIEAYEPVFLDLLSPGGNIQDTTSTAIFNTLPLFTWSSDYCSQCEYGIRVCEYNTNLHSSLSDAIEDISVLPSNQNIEFYPLQTNGSFAYPSQDAFDLIPNKLYVWQIQRTYSTTLGTQENKSEIFVFKISSFENLVDEAENNDPNKELLQALLGYKYEELFNNDGELTNFKVQNNTIILNDQVIPISNLYDIIEKLNSGEIQIIDIEVE